MGLLTRGLGAAGTAGVGLLGMGSNEAEAGPIMKGGKRIIEAWHGSPHNFDKFSMKGIGTGEGAQAYGHGLYFADDKGVAKGYKDNLAADAVEEAQEAALLASVEGLSRPDARRIMRSINRGNSPADAIESASDSYAADYELIDANKDKLLSGIETALNIKPEGKLYKTELDVDPDSLLDWDKPLKEQSEAVRAALKPHIDEMNGVIDFNQQKINEIVTKVKGEGRKPTDAEKRTVNDYQQRIYKYRDEMANGASLINSFTDAKYGSQYLKEKGIPGVKYLDGGSRNAGEGSSNYVMFDDKPVSIVDKMMAAAVPAAGVGLLGAGASNKGYAAPPTANDIFQQYGNEQQIQPAPRPMLANAANLLATKVDTPLDGLLGKGWISEGVGGLLNKFGYDDERTYPDFIRAALDAF